MANLNQPVMAPARGHFVLRPLALQIVTLMGLLTAAAPMLAGAAPVRVSSAVTSSAALTTSNGIPAWPAAVVHRFHDDHVLGTSLDVVVVGVPQAQAERALRLILAEIDRLDRVLSIWRDDSEISQFNRRQDVDERGMIGQSLSADLYRVLAACETWKTATCGAFSARLGQVLQAWQQANGVDVVQMPDAQQLAQHSQAIAAATVTFESRRNSVMRPPVVQFAPDALAKGYVIDRALMAVRRDMPNVAGLMVDIGGDVRVWGQSPRASGWQVGVRMAASRGDNQAPQQVLNLHNQAIAVSGQGARTLAGQSHLLQPETGQPIGHIEQTVVVANNAADADALATALAAMSPQQGMALVERLLGVEAHITDIHGRHLQSSGWQNMLGQHHQHGAWYSVAAQSAAASAAWPAGYTARLDYEIAKIEAPKYRAPYVVIWVTDANKQLVRTLHVWGKEPKWIDSNYVWWRRYGRKLDNLDSVAKPSRQAGRYSAVWDGLDDQGQRVAAGQYTVHIESAREHGQHSYQSLELAVNGQPSQQMAAAKDELGVLTLRFDRML